MHSKDGTAMTNTSTLIEQLRGGITCEQCGHQNDEHETLHEAANIIDELSEREDAKNYKTWMHLETHAIQLSGNENFSQLIALLQNKTHNDNGDINALLFLRNLIDQLHDTTEQNRQLQKQIRDIKNIPTPTVPLERIRTASKQPNSDVVWLQTAIDYIDELHNHINGANQ